MNEMSRIKARLESLGELGDLVGALRSMAASRAREAQEASVGTRSFRDVIARAMAEVSLLRPAETTAPVQTENRQILLVIASENGFVGLFNSRLIETSLELRTPEEEVFIIGRRGQIMASEHGLNDAVPVPMTLRAQGITALARRIVGRISGAASVRIVFMQHEQGTSFNTTVRRVLPHGDMRESAGQTVPVVHMEPGALLLRLSSEYLFAEIAVALMESLASENAARMRAMDAAVRNIDERIEALHRDERVARQEKTTTEMLDVVTGAEAVRSE